ncbi:MAG: chemotaxis protein CheB [Geodermatophilaceae bacterium]|nr:chemotaxis protein CheB [Geodermatophilaceae bacterium]
MTTAHTNDDADFKIVALVSSVGGLTATTEVLDRFPADYSAAILVLQHAEPTRISELPDILGRRTAVSVQAAVDGSTLRPGQVLVCPSGWHTLISVDLTVQLIVSGAYPPSRPSADLLLTTLAMAAGARVIAVVLTGGGIDGPRAPQRCTDSGDASSPQIGRARRCSPCRRPRSAVTAPSTASCR